MTAGRLLFTFAAVIGSTAHLPTSTARAAELVYVDPSGVIRWQADQREVALFGANYCLPSSSDYRAAGYLGVDRKKLIEQDMTHFARMGWDGLRLALWGDWENCDRAGNLIVNDHLDLLDYLIWCAKQRGISMLFTPMHRHSALWPDGKDSDAIQGFSKFYPPAELGTNPAAIAAQQNYLRQILAHINPYTGVALKDEPSIVFIELINEPDHHAEDFSGSVAYINALVDAVRSTGCKKLLFFNLSQDFRMSAALTASKIQGFTFGWYPTALGAGHTLDENYLRWVDGYTPLQRNDTPRLPRIVYEFDTADVVAGYLYPAMVRAYREVGAQFAAMFAYDMLATAPYNLGWQTHYLNLVYSPKKAVSAIIAAEAMRTLPRETNYGPYPKNRHFGPFRVNYEENLSELATNEKFFYSNDTQTVPPAVLSLQRIVGIGTSPVVAYEGLGAYFLDKLGDGQWRLEVYPDAIFVQDPFAQRLNHETISSRLIWHAWPMTLSLPDLGSEFSIAPLNPDNSYRARAHGGTFEIRPGVFLLSRAGAPAANLPERIGHLGLREFVCPPQPQLPTQIIPHGHAEYLAGQPLDLSVDVVGRISPGSVTLHIREAGHTEPRLWPMSATHGYGYRTVVPSGALHAGAVEFSVSVDAPVTASATWNARVVDPQEPLTLLDAARDGRRIFTLRTASGRRDGYLDRLPAGAADPAAFRLYFPAAVSAGGTSDSTARSTPHAFSLPVKARIGDRGASLNKAKRLRITARGSGDSLRIALVESDGTTWAGVISLAAQWKEIDLPLAKLHVVTGLKLPQGYPGNWNRDLPPAAGRDGKDAQLKFDSVEHLQICALSEEAGKSADQATADIALVRVIFD